MRLKTETQKKKRQKKSTAASLMKELQIYEKAGTHLYLGDDPCNPQEIIRACVFAENAEYMRDFVMNDRERVSELHFVRIREK